MRLVTYAALALLLGALPPRAGADEAAKGDRTGKWQSAVGRTIADFQLADFRGKTWSLAEFKDKKIVVVAFLGTECPLMAHYGPRLAELAAKHDQDGVAFLGINANQQDSLSELAHFARTSKIDFPLLKDPGNKVADQFGAQRTPEVYVLDEQRVVRYHGRIDDQFTYGIQRKQADETYLIGAIDSLLAGREIAKAAVEPIGCHIGRVLAARQESDVTYSNQIARILQDRCVECHRPGEIGPFSLTNYEEVVGWAGMIREVVREQRMPPWHASPEHGKFANDVRLTDEQKSLIDRWVAAGAPEGDPKDLPPPRKFVEGWRIGKPDQVVYMRDEPYTVPAKGEVRYQYFQVDPGFTEDKWVKAAECRPGNRAVVHHIIVYIKPPGRGPEPREIEGVHSEFLTATAPGALPMVLRPGMAKLVPAGSQFVFQMHYTPNGTAQEDRSCVGLVFADPQEVKHMVGTDKAANPRFRIPAGADNHKVEAEHDFGQDMLLISLFPHMHLRGKAFRYTAIYPDKSREVLLDVPRYDFNWQNGYELIEPKRMPAGTQLYCEAWFDNSAANLANPDPTQAVRWGDQTWEEMMIGYFDATPADREVGKRAERRTDEFLKKAQADPPSLGQPLKDLAAAALTSGRDLEKFEAALTELVPQLDRVCLTIVEGNELVVRQCVQPPHLAAKVGGAGRKVAVGMSQVARAAEKSAATVYPSLDKQKGLASIDLAHMSKCYGSSFHVPVKVGDKSGTINFWSTEKEAFPPEARSVLEAVAALMAGGVR
jgi:peroxiredoxin